jgi:hypothetical protein
MLKICYEERQNRLNEKGRTMGPSKYIGRVGGLAAALGIGVAVFTAPAVAWADTDSPSNASDSASASSAAPSRGDSPRARRSDTNAGNTGRVRTGRAADSAAELPSADAGTPKVATEVTAPRRNRASNDSEVPSPAAAATAKVANTTPAVPAATDIVAPAATTAPSVVVAPAASLPAQVTLPPAVVSKLTSLLPAKPVVLPTKPITLPVRPNVGTTLANVADRVTTAINTTVARIVESLASGSPFVPAAESPANWLLLAFTRRQSLPAAAANSVVQTNAQTLPVAMVLNGYNVVPTSIETVVGFYGQWTYWPGVSSTTQGKQDFSLVDPNTQQTVGNFSALVQQGDPTSLGTKYVELLVTANDGQNVGVDPGQIPPVGSIISSWTALGIFGWKYSSMPTSPTTNKVSFKAVTPFGDIPVPFFRYDAAKGVANNTFDNKPIDVTGGFFIVPADPVGEKITALSGLLPLFNSIQGNQRFNVVDSEGNSVGSFQGDYTTTGDVLNISTEAIRVTANDGINVGTGPGQVPPVGTVYNVAYSPFSDKLWLLYSSKPTDDGTVIEATVGTPFGNINFPSRLNASVEPPIDIVGPGNKTYIATSDQLPAGVNGLPPRDVQIQGYQQFDVRNSDGTKLGNVDTDVTSQWDSYGVHSKSLLITKVNEGTPGAGASDVPTVGTVVNVIYFGKAGFGISTSITPIPTGEVRAFQFLTPFGPIPLTPSTVPVGRVPVEYYNPFDIV